MTIYKAEREIVEQDDSWTVTNWILILFIINEGLAGHWFSCGVIHFQWIVCLSSNMSHVCLKVWLEPSGDHLLSRNVFDRLCSIFWPLNFWLWYDGPYFWMEYAKTRSVHPWIWQQWIMSYHSINNIVKYVQYFLLKIVCGRTHSEVTNRHLVFKNSLLKTSLKYLWTFPGREGYWEIQVTDSCVEAQQQTDTNHTWWQRYGNFKEQ